MPVICYKGACHMDCRPPETFYACPSPFKWRHLEPEIIINWLRVSDTAERSQVDQPIGHQLHAMVPVLETFESDQQSLELGPTEL
jgi:hypothetical protein